MKRHRMRFSFELFVYTFFLLLFFWMAEQVPYTHDDWHWGIEQGIQQLVTASVNSRYAGNFFVVVMTRSKILKTFIMGICQFLIPFLLADLAVGHNRENYKSRRFQCFLMSNTFLFLLDSKIWAQTFGWVAGFANYVISAVFLLICYKEWLYIVDIPNYISKESWPKSIFWGIICVISQLFIENLSIVIVFDAFLCCINYYWKTGKISKKYIFMFIGALTGLLLMFSSPIYGELHTLGTAVDGHRNMAIKSDLDIWGNLTRIFKQCASLAWMGIDENVALNIVILLSLLGLTICNAKNIKKSRTVAVVIVNLGLCVYYVFSYLENTTLYDIEDSKYVIAFIVSAFFYITVILEVFGCTAKNHEKRRKLIMAWGSALFVILPLAAIKGSGPRMMFIYYVFAVLFAIILVEWLMECVSPKISKAISVMLICILIGSTLLYVEAYAGNGQCAKEREAIITEAIENNSVSIMLPRYPHTRFLWGPYPGGEPTQKAFRAFYGINEMVEISLDSYPKVPEYWKMIK